MLSFRKGTDQVATLPHLRARRSTSVTDHRVVSFVAPLQKFPFLTKRTCSSLEGCKHGRASHGIVHQLHLIGTKSWLWYSLFVKTECHSFILSRNDRNHLLFSRGQPIQQLSRMDEEMPRSTANALPTRLAAKLWKARADSSVGDNPWKVGCEDRARPPSSIPNTGSYTPSMQSFRVRSRTRVDLNRPWRQLASTSIRRQRRGLRRTRERVHLSAQTVITSSRLCVNLAHDDSALRLGTLRGSYLTTRCQLSAECGLYMDRSHG
ncbi:hypothetical protein SAMN04488694_1325 [Natrinema hispanicum]|uniref:Uncharacterized protein n=1 Tax=Natrinema hispanicum TaxID=392421 RepID=A0A1I0J501_9EURY|nr:hypothetical protein SAMN04488694_1325 [Natrinema hispanicum]